MYKTRVYFFFFFQAEDGIRDVAVTGVQTCALPILEAAFDQPPLALRSSDYVGVLNFVAGPGLPMARQKLPSITGTRDETRNIAGANIGLVRDNWPFLYYNPNAIPFVYLGSLLLVIGFGWFSIRGAVSDKIGRASCRERV